MGGGTVLVVNLPPAHSNFINHQQQQPKRHSPPSSYHGHHPHVTHSTHGPHSNGIDRLPLSSGTLLSDYSNTYIEVRILFMPFPSFSLSFLFFNCFFLFLITAGVFGKLFNNGFDVAMERRISGNDDRIRMFYLLRTFHRQRFIHVRTHVHVLRMRSSAMERERWRSLSSLSCCDSRRYQNV